MEKDENEKNHRMEIFLSQMRKLSLSQHPRSSCAQVAMMNTRWFFDVGKLSHIFSNSLTGRWCFQHFFPSFLSFLFCKYFPYSTLTLNVINLLLPSIFVTFNSSHIVVVSSASNTSIYDFKVWLFSLISSQKTWPSDLIYRLFYECVCVWLCGKSPPVVNSIHCCCCMDSGETCNPIASHEMKLLFCW